jgi:hypothetical protein
MMLKYQDRVLPQRYIIVAKQSMLDRDFEALDGDFRFAFKRLNLWTNAKQSRHS